MVQNTERAAALRQRAADLLESIKDLPAAEHRDAMIRYRALIDLAEVEDWVAIKPHQPANYDYKLTPKRSPPPAPTVRGRPGRKVRAPQQNGDSDLNG